MRKFALVLSFCLLSACEGTIDVNFEDADSFATPAPGARNPTQQCEGTACGAAETPGVSTVAAPQPEPCPSASCGEALFITACASCHGVDANGAATFSGSVAGFRNAAPVITNGRGDMAAIAYSAGDLESLQLYLDHLAAPDPTGWTADEMYARRCAGCHGANGEGGGRGYQLRHPVDGYFDWVTRNGIHRREFSSEMPSYDTAQITNSQIAGMISSLRKHPIPTDGQGLYELYCANCHGMAANGGSHPQGLLWVKDFGPETFYGIVRSGVRVDEYDNVEYMPAYSTAKLSDQDIDNIVRYIKTSL